MIEVQNLTKEYSDHKAVNNISFSVKSGEILGFLGQNGAGKSTTMKILTGYMPPTSGVVKIAGLDVLENPMEIKRQIGYLPENPPVYNELLVLEYLSFIADLRGIKRAEKTKAIDKALSALNLGDVRKRLIGNLSKGFRQRVGFAQALLHDPKILILDEPMVGLDPKQLMEARDLIRSMRGNRTVIYSTHILSEVSATCTRIIIINKGNIVAQDSLGLEDGVGSKIKTEIVVKSISDGIIDALKGVKGVSSVQPFSNGSHRIIVESDGSDDVMMQLSKAAIGGGLIRMTPMADSLESYYLDLIGGKRGAL